MFYMLLDFARVNIFVIRIKGPIYVLSMRSKALEMYTMITNNRAAFLQHYVSTFDNMRVSVAPRPRTLGQNEAGVG